MLSCFRSPIVLSSCFPNNVRPRLMTSPHTRGPTPPQPPLHSTPHSTEYCTHYSCCLSQPVPRCSGPNTSSLHCPSRSYTNTHDRPQPHGHHSHSNPSCWVCSLLRLPIPNPGYRSNCRPIPSRLLHSAIQTSALLLMSRPTRTLPTPSQATNSRHQVLGHHLARSATVVPNIARIDLLLIPHMSCSPQTTWTTRLSTRPCLGATAPQLGPLDPSRRCCSGPNTGSPGYSS